MNMSNNALSRPLSRRGFLKMFGLLGAGILASRVLGETVHEMSTDDASPSSPRRILVTYASRRGSTREIAFAVAEELRARGMRVDLRPMKKARNPAGYDFLVLGSAVRYGHWLPEAEEFVHEHQSVLREKRVVFFTVHMLGLGGDPESLRQRLRYTERSRDTVAPEKETFFAGRLDMQGLSWWERTVAHTVGAPTGDLRDWTAIRKWARELSV